jgi:hypothetical protein
MRPNKNYIVWQVYKPRKYINHYCVVIEIWTRNHLSRWGMSPVATEIALEIFKFICSSLFLLPFRFLLLWLLRTSNRSLQEKNRSKNRLQNCSIRVRIVVASRFIYELLLLGGSTGHTHKAREGILSLGVVVERRIWEDWQCCFWYAMAVVVHYVIAAPSIMEVSLLLWLFFANLFLLFVVSLYVVVVVCRCFV